jgi:hypothetical protein
MRKTYIFIIAGIIVIAGISVLFVTISRRHQRDDFLNDIKVKQQEVEMLEPMLYKNPESTQEFFTKKHIVDSLIAVFKSKYE